VRIRCEQDYMLVEVCVYVSGCGYVCYLFLPSLGALTEHPPTERPSDILTRTEHPLDDWSTVTGRPQ
jgi:hypothetical protein